MKTHKLNCPGCGANLEITTDKDFAFCQYCGTKLMITAETVVESLVQMNANKNASKERINQQNKEAEVRLRKSDNNIALEMQRLKLEESKHDARVIFWY